MIIILFLGEWSCFCLFATSAGFSAVMSPSLRFQVILLGTPDEFDTVLSNDQKFLGLDFGKFWKNSLSLRDRRDLETRRRFLKFSPMLLFRFLFDLRLAVSFLFSKCWVSPSNQGGVCVFS